MKAKKRLTAIGFWLIKAVMTVDCLMKMHIKKFTHIFNGSL